MSDKCFCHLGEFQVKDATARAEIANILATVNAAIAAAQAEVDALEQRFDNIINRDFIDVTGRNQITGLQARCSNLETEVDSIETDISELESSLEKTKSTVSLNNKTINNFLSYESDRKIYRHTVYLRAKYMRDGTDETNYDRPYANITLNFLSPHKSNGDIYQAMFGKKHEGDEHSKMLAIRGGLNNTYQCNIFPNKSDFHIMDSDEGNRPIISFTWGIGESSTLRVYYLNSDCIIQFYDFNPSDSNMSLSYDVGTYALYDIGFKVD